MTSPPGGGSRRKRPVLVPVLAVLLATGMGTTAVLGGLNEAPDPPPPMLGPGDTLDQGQFVTKIIGAKFHVLRGETEYDEDKRLLDLDFGVTNEGDSTIGLDSPVMPGEKRTPSSFPGTILKTVPAIKTEYGAATMVLTP